MLHSGPRMEPDRTSLDGASSTPCLLVTVDTEEDNAWGTSASHSTRNAEFLPRFHRLCGAYGVRPTYLVNHAMATCPVFVAFGREVVSTDTGEIGMHLHAWNTPPLAPLTNDDAFHHTYLIEYDLPVMRAKVLRLTGILQETFDVPMHSHRAGRWAFDGRYARLLLECGYRVDCSVTPHISWQHDLGSPHGRGGTDYTGYPEAPYYLDPDDPSRPSKRGLLELPMTILRNRRPLIDRLHLPRRSLASRAVNRLWPPTSWLRPNGRNHDDMIRILDAVLWQRRSYAQFAIHSSELMPGGSPTFPGAEDVERLYRHIEGLFSAAQRRFATATLSEFASRYAHSPSAPSIS